MRPITSGGIADVARVKMAVGGRGFDAAAYLTANPDVLAAQQAAASGAASQRDINYWRRHYGADALSSPERFAAVHYNYAQRHTPHQAQRYYDELDRRQAEQRAAQQAAQQAAFAPAPAARPAAPPPPLPAARPLFPGSDAGVPQTPGYVPPAFDVSASPYVSAGAGFGGAAPNIGGSYDDAVRRAQQYFSSMQPGSELIDPADAVMVPPMPTQGPAGRPALAALPPLLPEEAREMFAYGGSPHRMRRHQ